MAIFDSEKRPRGLRVPSLTAMKSGAAASKSLISLHKKSSEAKTPEEEITPIPTPTAQRTPPARPAPPSNKELPPPPKDQLPPPPRMPTTVPPRREVPRRQLSPREAPREAPREIPPTARPVDVPLAPQPIRPSVTAPALMASSPQSPPEPRGLSATLSPPPDREYRDTGTPLEDFIPTPEPEPAENPLDPVSSDEPVQPYTPPEVEPVAAPLNRVHFACFQDHRAMPVAQNEWCPLRCQTCHKFDREIRHRCVFCCLRICEACYQGLQKCPNRSLAELMKTLNFD
ncbi:hypothetical protein N7492_003622 [Penicillium capsulatum]|uniref:Uncharacterized protein n=1 Tax=Penicillium capsulatum TaxID=69766 RepID=A0A9W9LXL8_9EURO|nr:hypothetical protein N7492_003622 [Penicillium capsulatum]KAJ6121796.1 hypothetical protein N7512_004261 [Penicillium capsulatum]